MNDVAKNTSYDDWVKKVNIVDSNKQNLGKKIEAVDKKIPDTSKLILTQDFNRLRKLNFNARMT